MLVYKFHPLMLVEATWCGNCLQSCLGFSIARFFVQQDGGGGGILDIDSKQGD